MKKKWFILVILLIVVLFGVWRGLFELHNSAQEERIAILPIKVWEQLVDDPAFQCWILPGDRYHVDDDYSHGDWTNVESARCRGIAQVRPSR